MDFLRTLQQDCRADRLRLDCGANLGGYTRAMHDWLPDGWIIAFEPVPGMYRRLADRFEGVRGVTCLRLGVGDREVLLEEQTILEAWSLGTPGVHPRNLSLGALEMAGMHHDERFTVQLVTIDDPRNKGVLERPIDFIKLDVDGYEPAALRGAERTLRRDRPTVLLELGYHCTDLGESVPDFLDFIYDRVGYRLITQDGTAWSRGEAGERYPYTTSFDVAMVPQEWDRPLLD